MEDQNVLLHVCSGIGEVGKRAEESPARPGRSGGKGTVGIEGGDSEDGALQFNSQVI